MKMKMKKSRIVRASFETFVCSIRFKVKRSKMLHTHFVSNEWIEREMIKFIDREEKKNVAESVNGFINISKIYKNEMT